MAWLYDSAGHIDWRWIITALIALSAVGVAIYREVAAHRGKRTHLKVILSFDLLIFAGDGTPAVPHLQVRVENHGGTDITFNTNGVSLIVDGYGSYLLVVDPITNAKFPCVLKPGTSFYLMKEKAPFIESLRKMNLGSPVKVRALMQDAIVRPFYSDWVKVDLSKKAK